MEQRIAVIDLGSNTCRLVIFAYAPGRSFKLIDQVAEQVRIGEGMFDENRLQPEPMARAVKLLKMFRKLCEANQIDRLLPTATSAVRDAVNRDDFLHQVKREAGLELRVLSDEEEAYYAYLGAVNSLPLVDGLVADLGGGSLELTRVHNRLPVQSVSLPLGAVRMAERFLSRDPIKPREARALFAFVDAQLAQVEWLRVNHFGQLVVLGGTMRALAKINQHATAYPLDRLHGYRMSRRSMRDWARELLERPLKSRLKISGLKVERADVLPAGAAVIYRLMKHLRAESLVVSGQGLREGLFYEQFLSDNSMARPGAGAGPFVRVAKTTGLAIPENIDAIPLIADLREFGISNVASLYNIELTHAGHVCHLALSLFDQLQELHGLRKPERELLRAAALLHDVGVVIDYYRHHLHSAYLIQNADLPGFTQREVALIELLVRWHRHGTPGVEPFDRMLAEGDAERVQRLAVLLRLAEDLERSRAQIVREVHCQVQDGRIQVEALTRGTGEAELWAASRDSEIFKSIYGLALRVSSTPIDRARESSVEAHR